MGRIRALDRRGGAIAPALAVSCAVSGAGVPPASANHSAVTTVTGDAFGYHLSVSVFGGHHDEGTGAHGDPGG